MDTALYKRGEANTTIFEYTVTTGIAAQAVSLECFAMYEQDLILANGVISNTNKISVQPTGTPV